MCIAVVTTAHPQYPFVLLNNRDEYLHRPTADAQWWEPPNSHVLGGFDLHRPVHGTWLGITRQGRIAVLTNFREEGAAIIQDERSRGAIVNAWLKTRPDSAEGTADFARRLVEEGGVKGVGGFSLLYGRLQDCVKGAQKPDGQKQVNGEAKRESKGLAILSNRTPDVHGLIWLAGQPNETHALSNSYYGDTSWPKIVRGEAATHSAVTASAAAHESRDELLDRLFGVLSEDSLPRQRNGEGWDIYLRQLRNSIFIPAVGRDGNGLAGKPADEVAAAEGNVVLDATSGIYGTQKQTVVLVDWEGRVTFVERSLFDQEGRRMEKGKGDRKFEFQIEGW